MSTDDEDDEEDVPLNIHRDSLAGDGGSPIVATKDSDRRVIGHDIEGEEEDDDDDAGCATYGHQFRMGRYSGYCTLGRVSLHDSWDCADGESDANGENLSPADGDEDRKIDHGGFVSFWRQKDGGDPSSSGGREERALPLIIGLTNQELHTADYDCDDDRVEITMRPIPLLYRGFHGGLEQNAGHDAPANSFGLWFKRELGIANLLCTEVGEPELSMRRRRRRRNRGNGPWNLWKRREASDVEDIENAEDEGGDANSLISSSSSDEILWRGMPNQVPKDDVNAINHENSIFGGQSRRGCGVLALPIIRPFLRGSRRGFTDNSDLGQSSNEMGNEEDGDGADYADGLLSRRDRAAVIQSISQGIVGTTDDSLLIDANCGDDVAQSTIESRPPIWLGGIFVTRFFQGFGNQHKNYAIIQLHNLLRKEDWSLATTLLQTKPELAQTWYCINRLYGGKYDGEALPIHAASALCPPPSFIEMLGALYPEGLLEKDKAFGRVPLHVACRCVASSSVIRVLCEMEPKCVVERDDLKRVPLHYLLKNYCSFGDDDDDDTRVDGSTDHCIQEGEGDEDGMIALKILLNTDPGCVHAADHRGWLPLHVACGSSSHKGMLRVLSLLLKIWPESVLVKTDKDSDALSCVDMAGKHHPTKARVRALLQEATCKVHGSDAESEQGESNKKIGESYEESFQITSPSPSSGQRPDDIDDELLHV